MVISKLVNIDAIYQSTLEIKFKGIPSINQELFQNQNTDLFFGIKTKLLNELYLINSVVTLLV